MSSEGSPERGSQRRERKVERYVCMRVLRLVCTGVVSVYLCASCLPLLRAQTPAQQQPPQTPPQTPPAQPPATPAQPPKPATGGFESVPTQQQQQQQTPPA